MGGYDLIDLDRGGLGYDKEAIAPDTGQVTGSACFASKWLDFLDPLIEAKLNSTGPVCSPAYPLPSALNSSTRCFCAPLCTARTLNCHRSIPGHAITAVRALL